MRRQANLRKQGKKNMKCHNFLWIVLLILPTAMIFLFWEFQRNKEAELGTLMKSESKTTLDKFSFTPISSTSGVNEKIIDSHEQEFGNVSIDTLIQVMDNVNIIVDDTIPLNQRVNVSLLGGKGFNIPIKGDIPVDQKLNIGFDELLPVKSTVPVDLLIIDTLPVGLSLKIPVDINVPVEIPLKTKAKISFDGPLPVDADVPIKLSIPVDIPLESTSLSIYFKELGKRLRNLPKIREED